MCSSDLTRKDLRIIAMLDELRDGGVGGVDTDVVKCGGNHVRLLGVLTWIRQRPGRP